MDASTLHPAWKLEGVRKHLWEHSTEISDGLLAIYEQWGQDLTVEGQLTNCFLRHHGDALEDESICKLAAIALQSEPIAYGYLINAFYQKLRDKENSAGSSAMYRITPNEIEEIWAGLLMLLLSSCREMPQPPTRQLPKDHEPVYPSFSTFYNQALVSQKEEIKEEVKRELKADLIDHINQAVKREILVHTQKELEPSFEDEPLPLLRARIRQDAISRLLWWDNNPGTSGSGGDQVPEEEDYTSRLQETSLQNKRLAPVADMGQNQVNKKAKVMRTETSTPWRKENAFYFFRFRSRPSLQIS